MNRPRFSKIPDGNVVTSLQHQSLQAIEGADQLVVSQDITTGSIEVATCCTDDRLS